jgi:ornithine decarboxylase
MKDQYRFPLENFMPRERFERIKAFAKDKETPCLIIDLDVIRKNYQDCAPTFPSPKFITPSKPIRRRRVELLRDLGSSFDVATRFELDQLLRLGVDPIA